MNFGIRSCVVVFIAPVRPFCGVKKQPTVQWALRIVQYR